LNFAAFDVFSNINRCIDGGFSCESRTNWICCINQDSVGWGELLLKDLLSVFAASSIDLTFKSSSARRSIFWGRANFSACLLMKFVVLAVIFASILESFWDEILLNLVLFGVGWDLFLSIVSGINDIK